MARRVSQWIGLFSLLVTFAACRDLPRRGAHGQDEVPVEGLPSTNVVPAAWGRLVAVSDVEPGGNASLLWFQDDSGEVRMVSFDRDRRQLWPQAAHIRRR